MMPSFRVMSPKFVHKVLIRYYHETLNPERKELWWGMVKNFLELFMCNRVCGCARVCVFTASYETWLALCEEYAEQLEEEGLYHKAVSYLLACHKLYPAIDLFRRHKLFR